MNPCTVLFDPVQAFDQKNLLGNAAAQGVCGDPQVLLPNVAAPLGIPLDSQAPLFLNILPPVTVQVPVQLPALHPLHQAQLVMQPALQQASQFPYFFFPHSPPELFNTFGSTISLIRLSG